MLSLKNGRYAIPDRFWCLDELEIMNLEKKLQKIEKADRFLDRLIERIFILIASAFGAWLTWNVLGVFELGLLFRLGGVVVGALVCATAMWLFWFVARFLA